MTEIGRNRHQVAPAALAALRGLHVPGERPADGEGALSRFLPSGAGRYGSGRRAHRKIVVRQLVGEELPGRRRQEDARCGAASAFDGGHHPCALWAGHTPVEVSADGKVGDVHGCGCGCGRTW